jgi:curved DNA-binding protein CbpA
MFRNPNAQDLFQELNREFEKHGVRFDQEFINRVLFGGRGFFFGGVFFGGPISGRGPFFRGFRPSPSFGRQQKTSTLEKERSSVPKTGILSRLGQKIETLLLGSPPGPVTKKKTLDVTYHLTLTQREVTSGSKIRVAYDRGKKSEKLDVTIPPGTKSGSRLRLKGKGLPHPHGGPPGDLYLHIKIAK